MLQQEKGWRLLCAWGGLQLIPASVMPACAASITSLAPCVPIPEGLRTRMVCLDPEFCKKSAARGRRDGESAGPPTIETRLVFAMSTSPI